MRHCRPRSRRFAALLLLLVSAAPLAAHDMWIEPTAFTPEPGVLLGLRLRVGQDFLGDPLVRDVKLIDRFVVSGKDGVKNVLGREHADPAGLLRPSDPGLLIVGYQSTPSPVVLPPAKFQQYLTDEGLEPIAALRASRGQTDAEAREVFTRCAKTLVLLGPAAATQKDQVLHFILELTAEQNPYVMHAGETLPFRLTYQEKPLAGALVVAINQREPSVKVSARTDRDGRVHLALGKPGAWLIKAVHMIPAPAGSASDWASFWASLTFELPPASGRASR